MNSTTLSESDPITIEVDGSHIQLRHIIDADGSHALQLGGVDCNLEGELPGLYYPVPLNSGRGAQLGV